MSTPQRPIWTPVGPGQSSQREQVPALAPLCCSRPCPTTGSDDLGGLTEQLTVHDDNRELAQCEADRLTASPRRNARNHHPHQEGP